MSHVRAQGLRGYSTLVSELGGDPAALLEGAHIAPAALDDLENFVPYPAVTRLLESTARILDCPDFGLRLSQRQDVGILGSLAVAMQNSATVGEALACSYRYIRVHSPAIRSSLRPAEREEHVLVVFEIVLERLPAAVQVTELSIGVSARILSLLTGARRRPRAVLFPHPPAAPRARYREHLGVPVIFEADCAALELAESDLSLPILPGSRALRELAIEYLDLHYASPSTPLSIRVRGIVRRSFGTGCSSCEDVASAMALHPRTLQRRLSQEGASFEQLKDEARADLARRYLVQRDLSLSQVAALLDYSEQSALTRSCRRWFGKPPKAVRADLLREALAKGATRDSDQRV
jgi:AraC-like DNA-binding protein